MAFGCEYRCDEVAKLAACEKKADRVGYTLAAAGSPMPTDTQGSMARMLCPDWHLAQPSPNLPVCFTRNKTS